jgi:hypothetical protein
MPEKDDTPVILHSSFSGLIDSFRTIIAALTWLRASSDEAAGYFAPWPYIITFDCSVSQESLKLDKSAIDAFRRDAGNPDTPMFASTLGNLCRVVTISVKDIIWEHPHFSHALQHETLQFIRHIRNAAAHDNSFYFGAGKQKERTLAGLPVSWRGKTVDVSFENSRLYLDFMGAGDLLFLLRDVTALARPPAA